MKRIPFTIKDYKEHEDCTVVNSDGDECDVYKSGDNPGCYVIISKGESRLVIESAKDFFIEIEEITDSNLVDKVDVSDNARRFQNFSDFTTKQAVLKCANWFIDMSGIFGHYAFFTKELWRNVPGFKNEDKGNIIAVFLHWWFRYEYGYQNMPCGSAWTSNNPKRYGEKDESFDRYIEKYRPVIEAYYKWCENQR